MSGFDAPDLFAGAGGFDTGAAMLGIRTVGIELSKDACATARAAGHIRVQRDATRLDPTHWRRAGRGLIGSPPCPPFSKAGKRLGLLDQPRLFDHLDALARAHEWVDYGGDGWHDPDSPLVLEPLRWALALSPEWIVLEQVPDVLPFWERLADLLREFGYRCWTGVLDAEMYGVPQTRDRAILTASRNPSHAVSRPPATHRRFRPGVPPISDELFDDLLPWVSMADALGWGFTDEPACTVSVGGAETGGAEPFANANYRRRLAAHVFTNNDSRRAGGTTERFHRPVSEPSPTITGSTRSWTVRMLAAGATSPRTAGTRPRDPATEPSATITGKGTAAWVHSAPATTVQGDPRIAPRGHHDRQFNGETVRVTVEEAARLQSFPDGYPWHGTNGSRHQQVGNAVPPLLAVAIFGHLLAIDGWRDICRNTYGSQHDSAEVVA